MPNCDLDECSLKDDIGEIKENQKEQLESSNAMITAQAVFVQKVDDYIEQNVKDVERLFIRTRRVVKWSHLSGVVFVLGVIIGIVWKFANGGG